MEFRAAASATAAVGALSARGGYRFDLDDEEPVHVAWATDPRSPSAGSDGEEHVRPEHPRCRDCGGEMRWSSFLEPKVWRCTQGAMECPANQANAGRLRWFCRACQLSACEGCRQRGRVDFAKGPDAQEDA